MTSNESHVTDVVTVNQTKENEETGKEKEISFKQNDKDDEENEGENEGEDEEEEDEGEDDAGSLVDFVVDDEEEEDEASSIQSDNTPTEAIKKDMDGIDPLNIIEGKRVRRQTQFYETSVLNTDEYRQMMLCDIPRDEMHAALQSDEEHEEDEEEDEKDEDDENYSNTTEDTEGENESEYDEEEEKEKEPTEKTKENHDNENKKRRR
jgi:DNA polymerase alpha subunit A